jgi:hypothetical protein
MLLASLVSQVLKESEPRGGTIINPICPRCKIAPRAINKKSGCLSSYCEECRKDVNREYKRPKRKT